MNLVANGTGGPAEWARGLVLLEALAAHDALCLRERQLIAAMALTESGDPVCVPVGEPLSARPSVARIRSLFTQLECAFLREISAPMLQPAAVEDVAGRTARHPGRTSDSVALSWPIESPAVHALNRRMAAASGTRVAQGEPLQILRYRVGQEYRLHHDAIPGFANQRRFTILVWLNEDFTGGETVFPAADLRIRGGTGDALLFRNTDCEDRRDDMTAHAGAPVTRGEKWIASRWIRARDFHPG